MATGIWFNLEVSSGTWTPTGKRSASGNITLASGGTALTVPHVVNTLGGASTTTTNFGVACEALARAMENDRAANGDPSSRYCFNFSLSGSTWTPTVRKDATAASGGTTLTIPHVVNTLGGASTTSKHPMVAFRAIMRAALNSIAASGLPD